MTRKRPATAAAPDLPSGLSVLRQPSARLGGVRTLAIELLTAESRSDAEDTTGPAFWIDARNAASTYALYDLASGGGPGANGGKLGRAERSLGADGDVRDATVLRRLRIARAFTAYQHRELARAAVRRSTPSTPLIVAPQVTSLYADPDVPDWEREELARATLATLDELGESLGCPVLASVARDDELAELAVDRAATEIECRRTDEGYYFGAGEFETTVYWGEGYWQTTIPYWSELLGAVDDAAPTVERPEWALAGV